MMKPSPVQSRKKGQGPQLDFVKSVRVAKASEPLRVKWKHAILAGFWFLIGVKCLLAYWAIAYWEIPFGFVYIWAPTVFAGVVCTILFLSGDRDPE